MEKNNQTNLEDLIKKMENLPVPERTCNIDDETCESCSGMKQLKDTKIGKFLAEKAPDVLDVAGSLLPDAGLLGVLKI